MSDDNIKASPQDIMDLIMRTTDSLWGSDEVSKDLREKLSKHYKVTKEGETKIVTETMWGWMNIFTRDLRLANLNSNEMKDAQHFLNLSSDYLHENMVEPCLVSLSRVATILELSQSKDGFFRKMNNTKTNENIIAEKEPAKRSLFGGQRQNGGRY